jgi:hypothetical protein
MAIMEYPQRPAVLPLRRPGRIVWKRKGESYKGQKINAAPA